MVLFRAASVRVLSRSLEVVAVRVPTGREVIPCWLKILLALVVVGGDTLCWRDARDMRCSLRATSKGGNPGAPGRISGGSPL